MKREYLVRAFSITALFFSLTTFAASEQTDLLSGVIEKVDHRNKTLIITNDQTGERESYQFDQETKVILEGKKLRSQKVLKPGVTVRLKMPTVNSDLAKN